MPNPSQTDITDMVNTHVGQAACLQLATINADGKPELSSAPFVRVDDCFFIFISELAGHYNNLQRTPACAALIIEDEQDARNAFARTRLSLQCNARFIARDAPRYTDVIAMLLARHGETVSVLAGLADFHLCALQVERGRLISGFAKTYTFEAMALATACHVRPS